MLVRIIIFYHNITFFFLFYIMYCYDSSWSNNISLHLLLIFTYRIEKFIWSIHTNITIQAAQRGIFFLFFILWDLFLFWLYCIFSIFAYFLSINWPFRSIRSIKSQLKLLLFLIVLFHYVFGKLQFILISCILGFYNLLYMILLYNLIVINSHILLRLLLFWLFLFWIKMKLMDDNWLLILFLLFRNLLLLYSRYLVGYHDILGLMFQILFRIR